MRVWFVPPCYLDDTRLVAAHNELHICYTVVLQNKVWGHSKLFNKSIGYVVDKHETTIREMAARSGLDLRTQPIPDNTPMIVVPEFNTEVFTPTKEMLIRDVKHLRLKWDLEGYYFGCGRVDLRPLEGEYGLPIGPSPERGRREREKTKLLVEEFKPWFEAFRQAFPRSRFQDRRVVFMRGLADGRLGCEQSAKGGKVYDLAERNNTTPIEILKIHLSRPENVLLVKETLKEYGDEFSKDRPIS